MHFLAIEAQMLSSSGEKCDLWVEVCLVCVASDDCRIPGPDINLNFIFTPVISSIG